MINFNWRELNADDKTCVITQILTPHEYQVLANPPIPTIIEKGVNGWNFKFRWVDGTTVWWLFDKNLAEFTLDCGTGEKFSIVGQAQGNTTTTEFLIDKKWSYADIVQTGFLIIIAISVILFGLMRIFTKKKYFD